MKMIMRIFLILPFVFLMSCNWGHKESEHESENLNTDTTQIDSSKIMDNDTPMKDKTGVGPVKDKVELGLTIDKEMAEKGKNLFSNNCATCHEIHESATGPALGGVLDKRSPQWVMNMILNPRGMVKEDPQARALKAVYETQMVDLHLSKEEAREIVEYLRNY
ncbi:MAG: c-type cytochrome [Aequorivita sp.]